MKYYDLCTSICRRLQKVWIHRNQTQTHCFHSRIVTTNIVACVAIISAPQVVVCHAQRRSPMNEWTTTIRYLYCCCTTNHSEHSHAQRPLRGSLAMHLLTAIRDLDFSIQYLASFPLSFQLNFFPFVWRLFASSAMRWGRQDSMFVDSNESSHFTMAQMVMCGADTDADHSTYTSHTHTRAPPCWRISKSNNIEYLIYIFILCKHTHTHTGAYARTKCRIHLLPISMRIMAWHAVGAARVCSWIK